ncbi:MAG: class II glutamine amidotransferase [Alphaproteobacteria bacterium]
MCELLGFSSSHPARLTLSLEVLSRHGCAEGHNRDGWGVAIYEGRDVSLLREAKPASRSALVELIETQGPQTTLAISHIRHATQGAVALANTQPFVRELSGRRHTFAHNGNLKRIGEQPGFKADRFRPVGETDSEIAFCALLQRLAKIWPPDSAEPPDLELRLRCVSDFAAELRELGPANFLYADGDTIFAHGHRRHHDDGEVRAPGLCMLQRSCGPEAPRLAAGGIDLRGAMQEVVLVASVPLSDERWRPLEEGEVIAITGGQCKDSVRS